MYKTDELNQTSIREVLCQSAAPILFLDSDLNIVFFTPAITHVFNMLSSDKGRPLADLCSRAATIHLLSEVQETLNSGAPCATFITLSSGRCFDCVITQCPPWESGKNAVVLVFTETTEERRLGSKLASVYEHASRQHITRLQRWSSADQRLRQSAQAVALIAGQLAATKYDPFCSASGLVEQLGENMEVFFGRLATQLDGDSDDEEINTSDALDFSIQDIFDRLAVDLWPLASVRKIRARAVASTVQVRSYPDGLARILGNVIFNVVTHMSGERLSLGCRRRSGWVDIELRYTGQGRRTDALCVLSTSDTEDSTSGVPGSPKLYIPGVQLQVKTQPGKGTLISISVPLSRSHNRPAGYICSKNSNTQVSAGMLLIVEPDDRLRDLLSFALGKLGYQIAAASDACTALECIAHSGVQPDLILTAYALGQQIDGVQLVQKMREQFRRAIPAIILSTENHERVCQLIWAGNCTLLRKPVGLNMLTFIVSTLLRTALQETIKLSVKSDRPPIIFLVNDDGLLKATLRQSLEADSYEVQDYSGCAEFLASYSPGRQACLIVDAHMSGMNGLELARRLRADGDDLPIIMISSQSSISSVVDAMNVGICDFIEKPFRRQDLLTRVANALLTYKKTEILRASRKSAIDHIAHLTVRQRQIMAMVLAGQPSKNIAVNLGISQRTVEKHRASIMSRTEAKSIPELARLALEASALAR
ncbi:response regulator [Pseudomonas sp. KU26590]|uniref:response regulator n=1 Tax=Pseudomonas sp. KU26590 TaxID=2991051 RepID=UPI00223E4FDA|nr:response regulator [Pseudomonas sp. KU26590]UZJ57994.1 response regulator [Pseudomonas sp. KU26590]